MDVDVIIPAWTGTLDHLSDTLDSLRPYMRPHVIFNGPNAELISQHWWDQDLGMSVSSATDEWLEAERPGCRLCNVRNWGVQLSSAPLVAFLDADDIVLPEWDAIYEAVQRPGVRGAFGNVLIAHDDGSDEHLRDQAKGPLGAMQPCTGSFVLRRQSVVPFDVQALHQSSLRPNYDWWWWRAIGNDAIQHVAETVMVYRWEWGDTASGRFRVAGGWLGNGPHPLMPVAADG